MQKAPLLGAGWALLSKLSEGRDWLLILPWMSEFSGNAFLQKPVELCDCSGVCCQREMVNGVSSSKYREIIRVLLESYIELF